MKHHCTHRISKAHEEDICHSCGKDLRANVPDESRDKIESTNVAVFLMVLTISLGAFGIALGIHHLFSLLPSSV